MEMHAQCPSTAAPFNPNYPPRKAPRLPGDGVAPFFQINDAVAQLNSNLPGTFVQQQQVFVDGAAVFSGEPKSELTCNASGSRKRAFVDCVAHANPQVNHRRHLHVPREATPLVKASAPAVGPFAGTASSVQAYNNSIRLDDSAVASTSGRSPAVAPVLAATAPAISPLMKELALQHYQQSLDVDAFIHIQNERIRSGLENARKRHNQSLLSAIEQGVLRRLREKEAELESASRRNTELEGKIRQLVSENQVWFNVARNNEAIVSSLRATLEKALLRNTAAVLGGLSARSEGCGESDCPAPVFPAEDARSCCYEGMSAAVGEAERHSAAAAAAAAANMRELRPQNACRVCGNREVMVLLLPCRHLCLCSQCEPGVNACPVCNVAKNSILQVFMC